MKKKSGCGTTVPVTGVLLAALLFAPPAHAADPGPARQARLAELVAQDCGACHGMTRKGGLGPPLLPDALAGLSDEAIAATILDGRPDTPMPPWRGLLSDADAAWIARLLKGEADAR
jgi:cytochrome c55X